MPQRAVPVHAIDPLTDPRWEQLTFRHTRASVFHCVGWLRSLNKTYGHQPVVLTTSAPGEPLRDGLLFCRTRSWLTGAHCVSLPFSDHCDPLVESLAELKPLLAGMRGDRAETHARYCEIRPVTAFSEGLPNLHRAATYCMHFLDLRRPLEEIYRGFHDNCVQRKVRRAEREDLNYQCGNTLPLLNAFYRLLILTRQRHRLPPQPISWFRNLLACMGDRLTIRLASKSGRPVASILTLRHKDTLVFKYGCSDKSLSNLGGTPFLFWKAIQEAKANGITSLDLGRSDWDNPGLISFKDRLGARQSILVYWRDQRISTEKGVSGWQTRWARGLFGHLPASVLPTLGDLIYPHLHRSAPEVAIASTL